MTVNPLVRENGEKNIDPKAGEGEYLSNPSRDKKLRQAPQKERVKETKQNKIKAFRVDLE